MTNDPENPLNLLLDEVSEIFILKGFEIKGRKK